MDTVDVVVIDDHKHKRKTEKLTAPINLKQGLQIISTAKQMLSS